MSFLEDSLGGKSSSIIWSSSITALGKNGCRMMTEKRPLAWHISQNDPCQNMKQNVYTSSMHTLSCMKRHHSKVWVQRCHFRKISWGSSFKNMVYPLLPWQKWIQERWQRNGYNLDIFQDHDPWQNMKQNIYRSSMHTLFFARKYFRYFP